MKYSFRYFLFSLTLVAFISCRKDSPDNVEFNVSTAATTYKLSDSVYFDLTGNPDIITLYTGDSLNNYDNRNVTSKIGGKLNFGFQFSAANDSAFAAIASRCFRVLISTDFKNTYTSYRDTASLRLNYPATYKDSITADSFRVAAADSAMANAAKWTDLTDSMYLPVTGPVKTIIPSAIANITKYITNATDPFNIAFLYKADTTHYLGSTGIRVGGISLVNNFPDGTSSDFSSKLAAGGSKSTNWKTIRAANFNAPWTTSTTYLNFIPKYNAVHTEQWIISSAFYPNAATPDVAMPIKNITQTPLNRFAYKFNKLGKHKVVFVASNNRPSGMKQVVREIDLTIIQ